MTWSPGFDPVAAEAGVRTFEAGMAGDERLNPRRRVEATFERMARTRMSGAAVCNPALQVELVCVRRWQDEWLGVLITPWAINLILMPGGGRAFRALWPGDTQWWRFPSGAFEFLGNREHGLGAYQMHTLYAPALQFMTQEAARQAAHGAMEALFEPAGRPAIAPTSSSGDAE